MSYNCLMYHLVFSTKLRRPQIDQSVLLPRLTQYIGGIIRNLGGQMLQANGPEDHLHIASTMPTKLCLSEFLRDIKSNSTGWVRETFPDLADFGWQDDYAGFTVSPSAMPILLRYIRNQQEHHKKASFESELKLLLDKHGVKYDPRYLLK